MAGIEDKKKTVKSGKFRSLTITLAVAFLLLFLIILIIVSGFETYFYFQSQKDFINSEQHLIAADAANKVSAFIQEKFNVLETTVKIGNLASIDRQEQELMMEKVLGFDQSFRQLILLDSNNTEMSKVSRLSNSAFKTMNISSIDDIKSRTDKRQEYISSIYIDPISGEPLVVIAVPVNDIFGDPKGILMAEVNLKFMWDIVGNIKIGSDGSAYVVDRKGDLIAFGDISRVLKRENLARITTVDEFINSNTSTKSKDIKISTGIRDTKVISTYESLNVPDWAVIVELPVNEAYAPIIRSLMISFSILVLSFVLAILAGTYLSRRITRPLINLRDASISIGEGKLDTQIIVDTNDEIGELANSFNQMIFCLKKSREELEEYNKNLENKVKERTSELEKKDEQLLSFNRQLEEVNAHMDEANKKLKELDMQKDEFISLVAHELKTPLTSIQGFTQVLRDKEVFNDPEKNSHYLELVEKNANRLYNLVMDIVDSSRLNLGRLKFNIETHDPYRIFNEVKDDMSITISKKGLTPEFSIEDGLPKVKADFERTMQVLHNLMSNSIKFTTQGLISMHVSREGDYVKFEVKDTGPGIPDTNKASLFSRFYQVDSQLTRKVGGSGLGLSICKGLVEGMNGTIGFESEAGKGSTFHFTLPIAKE